MAKLRENRGYSYEDYTFMPSGQDETGVPYDSGTGQNPIPPAQPPAPQPQAAFNPFGGDMEAQTQKQLADFRAQASGAGKRVAEDDITAYAQMQKGLDSLAGPSPSGGGQTTASFSSKPSQNWESVFGNLQKLFPDGAFNQDVVNRRVSNVRDEIQRGRKGAMANNQAALAARGLIGDGPEMSAQNRLDERLYDTQTSAINDIYAHEGEQADSRMMNALQAAAGMTEQEAQLALDSALGFGRLGLDRDLGMGNLAIQNMNGVNDYNLGLGRLGLDRDVSLANLENADIDRLITLIEQMYNGAKIGAGGIRK
jgi:hypothetical protein